jgi:antitoxin ParD1/3/4
MNVSLTPELEQFINAKVKSGFYGSASEVIREGLRLLDEQDTIRQKRIELLNQQIDEALESVKAGKVISGDEAYRHIVERRAAYKQSD